MDEKLNISIDNYLNPKGFLGYFQRILYKFSKYKYYVKGDEGSNILILINNEFIQRNDHYKQAEVIFDALISSGEKVKFVSARRVLSLSYNNSFQKQFENVYLEIDDDFEKVLVFCDSVPLQNFIVNKFNQRKVQTYSLQHGFYAEDNNKVFLDVYKSSNSKNFFVWDERTLKYMRKHNPLRNYIKVGPHHSNNLKNKNKPLVNRIAIYGCGKDQKSENIYLCKIFNMLSSNGHDPIFIGHPKFSVIDRIIFFILNNVWVNQNKEKYHFYKLSIVLNSTVYLELENNNEPYFIINDHFQKKILPSLNELFEQKKLETNFLKPFLTKEKSIKLIIKNLVNDF